MDGLAGCNAGYSKRGIGHTSIGISPRLQTAAFLTGGVSASSETKKIGTIALERLLEFPRSVSSFMISVKGLFRFQKGCGGSPGRAQEASTPADGNGVFSSTGADMGTTSFLLLLHTLAYHSHSTIRIVDVS